MSTENRTQTESEMLNEVYTKRVKSMIKIGKHLKICFSGKDYEGKVIAVNPILNGIQGYVLLEHIEGGKTKRTLIPLSIRTPENTTITETIEVDEKKEFSESANGFKEAIKESIEKKNKK
jgi:hypothetical protein